MSRLAVATVNARDALADCLHGVESLLIRHGPGGICPDIAERHRPESGGPLAVHRLHVGLDVEQGDTVNGHAAELDRRAVAEVLVTEADVFDADISVHRKPKAKRD